MTELFNKMNQEEVIPLFSLEELIEFYEPRKKNIHHLFQWKCSKCGEIFSACININYYNRHGHIAHARCLKCHPFSSSAGISKAEIEISEFIRSIYSGKIFLKDRKTLKTKKYRNPFELDIYLPELKLAFEYNGLYWHCQRMS